MRLVNVVLLKFELTYRICYIRYSRFESFLKISEYVDSLDSVFGIVTNPPARLSGAHYKVLLRWWSSKVISIQA
jgi:hypothetical protein